MSRVEHWSSHAEQIVARLIDSNPQGEMDPTRADAARLGALHIGGSMWADYYLRPNGEVIVVGEDLYRPGVDTVYTDRSHVMRMLVWGARRYPDLRHLLPVRPIAAIDCQCRDHSLFGEGKVICPTCDGLGWLLV
jgi:hypothetical protein